MFVSAGTGYHSWWLSSPAMALWSFVGTRTAQGSNKWDPAAPHCALGVKHLTSH